MVQDSEPYEWVRHHEKSSRQTRRRACWAWVQEYGDDGRGCDGTVVVA